MAKAMSLRRSVMGEKKKSTGKGWRGSWRDRLDIPKGDATDILLCPGEYSNESPTAKKNNNGVAPVTHYSADKFHTFKGNVGGKRDGFFKCRCAGGWEKDEDCLGCLSDEEGDKRVQTRTIFSLNVLHLALYEMQELTDKKGKVRTYQNDDPDGKWEAGDPINGWVELTRARDRKDAKDSLDEGLADGWLTMWRKKYVEVGSGHLEHLMAIDDYAKKHCMCGGSTEPVTFHCEGCEGVLTTVEDSNFTSEERDQYAQERHRCDECGHVGMPDMEYICDECGDDAEPLNAFQVVASVRKTGTGTSSSIDVEDVTPLWDYELPDGSSLLEYDDDDELIEDEEGNVVFAEDVEKLVNNQLNFSKVHRPYDNDYIAQLLKRDNPFRSGKDGTRAYGKKQDSDDDDEKKTRTKPARGRGRGRSRR